MATANKRLVVRIGEALWGSIWASDMAACIGKGKRTTARYASGEREPSAETMRDLRSIMGKRIEHLKELIAELPE